MPLVLGGFLHRAQLGLDGGVQGLGQGGAHGRDLGGRLGLALPGGVEGHDLCHALGMAAALELGDKEDLEDVYKRQPVNTDVPP